MSTVITESYQGLLWNGHFVATVVLRLKQQNFKARLKDLKDLLVCVNKMKPCYHGAQTTSHENLAVFDGVRLYSERCTLRILQFYVRKCVFSVLAGC